MKRGKRMNLAESVKTEGRAKTVKVIGMKPSGKIGAVCDSSAVIHDMEESEKQARKASADN